MLEAAVVARPDPVWGETPCAFVTLKPEAEASAEEIIALCRDHLAHLKAPRTVIFGPLSKTSTGKIQKFMLRERAKQGSGDCLVGEVFQECSTSHAAVSTAHLSLALYPLPLTSGHTDNGPFFSVDTYNPGRTPVAGDQLGMYRIDGMSTSRNLDTQYGSIYGVIVNPEAGATLGQINIGTTQGGNPAAVTSVAVSKGVFTQDASGTGNLLSDCGAGCWHSVNINADKSSVTGTGDNTTTASPGSLTLTTSSANSTNLTLANTSVGGKQWIIQTGVIGRVGNIELQNGTDNVSAFRITPDGHWVAPGTSPKITSGFGDGANVIGSDVAGRVTVGKLSRKVGRVNIWDCLRDGTGLRSTGRDDSGSEPDDCLCVPVRGELNRCGNYGCWR